MAVNGERESFCEQMVVYGKKAMLTSQIMPSWYSLTLANSIDHYRLQMALSRYTSALFDNALSVYEFLSVVIFGLQERLKNGGVLNAE